VRLQATVLRASDVDHACMRLSDSPEYVKPRKFSWTLLVRGGLKARSRLRRFCSIWIPGVVDSGGRLLPSGPWGVCWGPPTAKPSLLRPKGSSSSRFNPFANPTREMMSANVNSGSKFGVDLSNGGASFRAGASQSIDLIFLFEKGTFVECIPRPLCEPRATCPGSRQRST
jgi:hypothetical protein